MTGRVRPIDLFDIISLGAEFDVGIKTRVVI